MSYDFTNRVNYANLMNISLQSLGARLAPEDVTRLTNYRIRWNYYEGYHWEDIEATEKPEVTENYCRAFVNKFVSFEFGKGFNIKMHPDYEEQLLPFLNDVWTDNDKPVFCRRLGQTKSVTGDGWVQVAFIPKFMEDAEGNQTEEMNPDFYDPFDEYEGGRIRLLVVPPNICFPVYDDGYDKEKLLSMTVMYPIRRDQSQTAYTGSNQQYDIYKMVWTRETLQVYLGKDLKGTYKNKYGIIPFFHIKNLELAGSNFGISDLEDLIPLNTELNIKKSDISEIIDYHSAPITLVFGARISQLEKGANKVWGGLPKDGKVENLEMTGDMGASNSYVGDVKTAMHEIGSVPEVSLGKEISISNTSGVALQLMLMPLIERVRDKQALSGVGLSKVNKLILKMGFEEGLLAKPEGKNKDLFFNEILFEDTLPKDRLVEIQEIQLEMKIGLCDREEAMKRLGKTDIKKRMKEIDEDMKATPYLYGLQKDPTTGELVPIGTKSTGDVMNRPTGTNKAGNDSQVNSGVTNSSTPKQTPNS